MPQGIDDECHLLAQGRQIRRLLMTMHIVIDKDISALGDRNTGRRIYLKIPTMNACTLAALYYHMLFRPSPFIYQTLSSAADEPTVTQ